ncbi:MAG TPA: type II toxin-antitoxin system VapC family toxin [Acidimicrobiales bacterium]|nr:type II toxin-antitoxin system VapC family toxin [Acidimicrobiales bacterium]
MILLDTNILIEHVRGNEAARDWLVEVRRRGRLATSVLCVVELTGGMRSAERRVIDRLLGVLDVIEVTEHIAHRAGELLRSHRRSHHAIGVVDYVIAATAQLHGLQLATLNVRHFPMFEGLAPPFAA